MPDQEQFVMVRLPLQDSQVSEFRGAEDGAMVVAHDDNEILATAIRAIGTPIQPGEDVETVGYRYENLAMGPWVSREIGYGPAEWTVNYYDRHPSELHSKGNYRNAIPLIRRTDMEAQVAKVATQNDDEIARLKGIAHGLVDDVAGRDRRINALLNAIRSALSIYEGIPEDAADSSDEIDGMYAVLHRALRVDLSPASKESDHVSDR